MQIIGLDELDIMYLLSLVTKTQYVYFVHPFMFNPISLKISRLWDLKFGNSCSVNAHNKKITCLHVSIDNRFVVTAGKDKTIRIWDFERKKQIECFGVESICIEKLAFRHDFKFLVSSSQDLVFMV